jgi:hypothetical protein
MLYDFSAMMRPVFKPRDITAATAELSADIRRLAKYIFHRQT